MNRTSATRGIAIFAAIKLLFHVLTNNAYGFHRDELQTLDDARHLAWGYVAYPPFTAFIGRIELTLFGTSLTGFRFFAAVAQCVVIVLAALLARRLGGGRAAQWIAAAAVAISPVSLSASALFQYVSFDILWWVVVAFTLAILIDTDDPRWWLPLGAAIGLGVETKYTMAFLIAGVVVAVLLTPLRRHLKSKWLWAGVALSLLIAAPNLIWQYQHDYISLDFLKHIHERDVAIGRTDDFLKEQFYIASNLVTVPLWIAGLIALFVSARLRKFRALAILVITPFILFLIAKGRGYYATPLYVPLIAAGAVQLTAVANEWRPSLRRVAAVITVLLLIAGSLVAAIVLPIAPEGSAMWKRALEENDDFKEQYGWPELTTEVARIYNTLPSSERAQTGIFASNYGEAGAINLYGPALNIPRAMSGINSFWYRGYDRPEPKNLIVLGADRTDMEMLCTSVEVAGHLTNRQGIENEETTRHRDVYLCRGMKVTLEQIWPEARSFG